MPVLVLLGIGLALWLGYAAIALGGQLIILSIDAAARGSGVHSPALGWVLVGAVLGAAIGGLYGLRRVGAPPSKRLAGILIFVPFGTLLMIGMVRGVPRGYGLPTSAGTRAETGFPLRGNNINLRSGPSTESRVLRKLPAGSRVLPLRITTTGEWTEVADASVPPAFHGWIRSSYLHTVRQPPHLQTPLEEGLLAGVAGKWNMRSVPTTGDATVRTYVLTATSNTSGWTITFPERAAIPASVSVDADSITIDAGPFPSVRREGVQVTIHSVTRLQGGNLVGTTTAHYKVNTADSVLRDRTTGSRAQLGVSPSNSQTTPSEQLPPAAVAPQRPSEPTPADSLPSAYVPIGTDYEYHKFIWDNLEHPLLLMPYVEDVPLGAFLQIFSETNLLTGRIPDAIKEYLATRPPSDEIKGLIDPKNVYLYGGGHSRQERFENITLFAKKLASLGPNTTDRRMSVRYFLKKNIPR